MVNYNLQIFRLAFSVFIFLIFGSVSCLDVLKFPTGTVTLDVKFTNGAFSENCRCFNVNTNPVNKYIRFPIDGKQPKANIVGILSCATIEANDESSEITKWYVEMFGGLTALQKAYGSATKASGLVNMGFDKTKAEKTIITVTNSTIETDFWDVFKTIASDPVGRVLLYRILIEIRRNDGASLGDGMLENGIIPQPERNECRSLEVEKGGMAFIPLGKIKFKNKIKKRMY